MDFGKPKKKRKIEEDFDEFSDTDEDKKDETLKDEDDLFSNDMRDPFLDDMGFDNFRPPPMEKHSDLLKGLTNFKDYLRKLYNNWLAINWSESQKKYIKAEGVTPIMNEDGANWCVSYIQTYVRDNNILGHLSEDEYKALNLDINRTLWLAFAKRYGDFGFTCYSDVIRVWNEVENASLLALSGAGGGKYSDFLGGGIIQHKGQYIQTDGMMPRGMMSNQQQKQLGMFGKMKNWLIGGK